MNHFVQINPKLMQGSYRIQENERVLRNGQIVEGEIVKLYPNNRAQIQIGSHRMIAEIRASLQIGRQYFFQVQTGESLIQLKVIGDQMKQGKTDRIANVLQELGMKESRLNIALMQALLEEGIPFQASQIQQASSMIGNMSTFDQAHHDVVKMMIAHRLPLTNNIFSALLARGKQSFSSHLEEMERRLGSATTVTELEEKLLQNLQNIGGNRRTFTSELVWSIQDKQTALAKLWNGMTSSLGRGEGKVDLFQQFYFYMRGQDGHLVSNVEKAQFPLSLIEEIKHICTTILAEQSSIQDVSNKLLSILSSIQSGEIKKDQLVLLKHMMERQMYGLLAKPLQDQIKNLLQGHRPEQMQKLNQLLQTLGDDSLYEELRSLTQLPTREEQMNGVTIQQRFLTYIQEFIQMSGMQDEVQLKTLSSHQDRATDMQQSIKAILLQMLGEPNVLGRARIEQIVHFINGMQLQLVQESHHFLHSILQLPGEKIGLNEDLFMHFEGKKDEEGKIDPNHCRILFVLQLKKIEETMIDVTIQKRIVSVTVYNEQTSKKNSFPLYERLLMEKLAEKQYTLSSVIYKPLYDMQGKEKGKSYERTKKDIEGIDYRI